MRKRRVRGRFKLRQIGETVRGLIEEANKILTGENPIKLLLEQRKLDKLDNKGGQGSNDENRA